MVETGYKITERNDVFEVTLDGKIVAKCLTGVDAALHAIWVMNGKDINTSYSLVNENVFVKQGEYFVK